MKLENKIIELIAIGASISANCQPCLEYHICKANKYGADKDEIEQAIETGKLVRRGASAKMDAFALKLNKSSLAVSFPDDKACGCNN